jgi:hypothetical protein
LCLTMFYPVLFIYSDVSQKMSYILANFAE